MNSRYSFIIAILVFSLTLLPTSDWKESTQLFSQKDSTTTERISEQSLPPPFFNISLLSPNTNPDRNTWVGWIADELPKIGIGISINDSTEWAKYSARSIHYDVDPITGRANYSALPPYDKGGYDVLILGHDANYMINPLFTYFWLDYGHPYSIDPIYNGNWNWYQNATALQLYADYISEVNQTQQLAILSQLQALVYDDLPAMNIYFTDYASCLTTENWSLSPEVVTLLKYNALSSGWATFGFNNVSPIIIGHRFLHYRVPFHRKPLLSSNNFDLGMVWQGLYERDPTDDFKWKPLIAKALPEWTNGNRTATVALREDVMFADGHQLTAHDVVASFRIMMTPAFHLDVPPYWSFYWWLCDWPIVAPNGSTVKVIPQFASNESIVAVDDFTVEFTWTAPFALAFDQLDIPILPSHVYGNHTHPAVEILGNVSLDRAYYEALRRDPHTFGFGTGPYRYKEIQALESPFFSTANLTLEAVATYWNGNVTTDEIIIRQGGDYEQALAALQNGTVHLLIPWYYFELSEVQETAGITFNRGFPTGVQFLTINMNHPILGTGVDTPLGQTTPARAAEAARYIRHAISHVIPRQKIVNKTIASGSDSIPAAGAWMQMIPGVFGYDDSMQPHTYNLTKAKELLAKAGYKEPEPLTNTTTATTSPTFVPTSSASSEDATFPFAGFLLGLVVLATVAVRINKQRKTRLLLS